MDATRQIVRALRETSRQAERDLGVSGAQLFALQRLQAGPLTINELAEQTATHQTSVSVVVQRLVDAGLVTRRVSPADRRRREVALTPRGREVLDRAPDAAQGRLVHALQALAAGQRRELARTLQEVVEALAVARGPAPMFFEEPAVPRARPARPRRRRG